MELDGHVQHTQHSAPCCCCCISQHAPPLSETLAEMAFSRSLSGFLIRGPTPSQVVAYVRTEAARLLAKSPEMMTLDACARALVSSPDPTTGYTALHHATRPHQLHRYDICELFLTSFGADPNVATPAMGWTCLHRVVAGSTAASLEDDGNVVGLLIAAGALLTPDAQGKTPLGIAQQLTYTGSDRLVAMLSSASQSP